MYTFADEGSYLFDIGAEILKAKYWNTNKGLDVNAWLNEDENKSMVSNTNGKLQDFWDKLSQKQKDILKDYSSHPEKYTGLDIVEALEKEEAGIFTGQNEIKKSIIESYSNLYGENNRMRLLGKFA